MNFLLNHNMHCCCKVVVEPLNYLETGAQVKIASFPARIGVKTPKNM